MPNKQNFPTREERRQLLQELRDLEKTQGREVASSELYQNYIAALTALDQKMEELYEIKDMGLPRIISAKDKEDLSKLLVDVGKAGELFLGDAQEKGLDLNAGIPRAVNRMQGMLAKDYQTLSVYDPEKNGTYLPVLQEHTRTKTIDLRDQNIKTLGNAQSSRIPMTFRGPNGEMRSGVFTKANYVQVKAPFLEQIERAKAQCSPEGAKELDSFLSKARAYHVKMRSKKRDGKNMRDTGDDFMAGYVLHRLKLIRKEHNSSTLKPDHVKEYMKKVGLNVDLIPKEAFNTLADGLGRMAGKPGYAINGYGLELKDGQRLDNRNSAMSAVADLLGAGSLLARSSNMRFIDERGEVTEGTFMDYGKGLDLVEDEFSIDHLNNHPLDNDAAYNHALKSIADLQILDALCLNVDRHQGNVMYRVDPKGNFFGLQGIDNDSSFGPRDLNVDDVMDMRVISRSMAEKIKSLTPEMLKFTLRGRGLNEDEIKAAGNRLNTIKEGIEHGMLAVVEDKEFSKLTVQDLTPRKEDNLFSMALRQVNKAVEQRRQYQRPFVPLKNENPPHLTDVAATGRKLTVGGLSDLGDKVSLLLRNEKTGFKVEDLSGVRGSSPEFKDMVEAARMVDHAGEFLKQNDPETTGRNLLMLDDPKAQKSVKVYNNVFMNLREKATEYLGKKMKDRHAESIDALRGKNTYEQARIDYAKKLLAVTEEYLQIRDEPLTEAERTERSRLMEFRSLGDRAEFKRHFDKGDQKPIWDKETFEKEHTVRGNEPKPDAPKKEPEGAVQEQPAQDAEKKQPEAPQGLVLH